MSTLATIYTMVGDYVDEAVPRQWSMSQRLRAINRQYNHYYHLITMHAPWVVTDELAATWPASTDTRTLTQLGAALANTPMIRHVAPDADSWQQHGISIPKIPLSNIHEPWDLGDQISHFYTLENENFSLWPRPNESDSFGLTIGYVKAWVALAATTDNLMTPVLFDAPIALRAALDLWGQLDTPQNQLWTVLHGPDPQGSPELGLHGTALEWAQSNRQEEGEPMPSPAFELTYDNVYSE